MADDDQRSVVVGVDGSDCSRSAVDTAVSLARQFGDRVVIVFGGAPPGQVGDEARAHAAAIDEVGGRATQQAADRAREQGVEAEVAMLPERPYEAITQAADEYDARFIVVGSYGERPIRGALLGAVPYKLLHTSETPVVVVRV
jgi:nucleotide-binding universal stress UspA family protein